MSRTRQEEVAVLAQWQTAKNCQALFGMSRSTLNELVHKGHIRAAKEGDANHVVRYRCQDIDAYLLAVSAGQEPPIVRGKVKP
ncbi:MAG: hypothetical protein RL095_2151 [Verrucomicrobiota bacterium]|jgi:hypothetical protein